MERRDNQNIIEPRKVVNFNLALIELGLLSAQIEQTSAAVLEGSEELLNKAKELKNAMSK